MVVPALMRWWVRENGKASELSWTLAVPEVQVVAAGLAQLRRENAATEPRRPV